MNNIIKNKNLNKRISILFVFIIILLIIIFYSIIDINNVKIPSIPRSSCIENNSKIANHIDKNKLKDYKVAYLAGGCF
ncbi:MAG: hypothetical protein QM532_00400 [Cyanobium sp. MAG06]|nr:hypothetical protein [Cyanobium sp. MAG06]